MNEENKTVEFHRWDDWWDVYVNSYWIDEGYWMEYWMKIYCYIDMIARTYHINIALEWHIPNYTIYKKSFDISIADINKIKKKLEKKAQEIDNFLEITLKD